MDSATSTLPKLTVDGWSYTITALDATVEFSDEPATARSTGNEPYWRTVNSERRWVPALVLTAIVLMTVGAIVMPFPLPRALVTVGVVGFSLAFGGYLFPWRSSGGQRDEHLSAEKDSTNG